MFIVTEYAALSRVDKKTLTHLSLMEFPALINWTSPFTFLGLLGGIFIQILIKYPVSK